VLVVGLVVASALFMGLFYLVGEDLRVEYHVLSRGDKERHALALGADKVAWLEEAPDGSAGVLWSELTNRKRLPHTIEVRGASPHHGIAVDGDLVAWTHRSATGSWEVRVHDTATNRTVAITDARDNLTLAGRTLARTEAGGVAIVRGTWEGEPTALVVHLARNAQGIRADGVQALEGVPGNASLLLEDGRLWWAHGSELRSIALATQEPLPPLWANRTIVSFDVDGPRAAWAEDHGLWRRVVVHDLRTGAQGEASAFPADQRSPALNGTRLAFVQHDGLVRLVDLATGAEKVLPARNQENIHVRLNEGHAAWLSGTILGHNVLLVPA
jgi:hypothetical protein